LGNGSGWDSAAIGLPFDLSDPTALPFPRKKVSFSSTSLASHPELFARMVAPPKTYNTYKAARCL
jgi:hypothetical protein